MYVYSFCVLAFIAHGRVQNPQTNFLKENPLNFTLSRTLMENVYEIQLTFQEISLYRSHYFAPICYFHYEFWPMDAL